MLLTRVLRPFLASLASGLRGRHIGPQGSRIINSSCLAISAMISRLYFFEVAIRGSPVTIHLMPWFLNSNWALYLDTLSSSRLLIVFLISFVVHLFTSYYRSTDPHVQRFYSYLSLFSGSRGVLVSADNYLRRFLGWEWIGRSSFLLICFWFTRVDAVQSALQALLYNRAGDWRLSRALVLLIWAADTRDFATIFGSAKGSFSLVCILRLLGARAKSAQVPRHSWLPNSREGPTPVSSLLHAATLVTAGVYLLIRSAPLLLYAPEAQIAVVAVGARTAFFAASTGLVQNDIKRIIAFSTCSQVGYRIAAAGRGSYDRALFHLINHGFFKALLFLGAGAVLHSRTNNQDIRYHGGGAALRPVTYVSFLIGSLALIAFPFRSGRYSKERIINSSPFFSTLLYLTLRISAAFTAYYSLRLISLTFFNAPRFTSHKVHEVPYTVLLCYLRLGLPSIFFGFLRQDAFLGPGSDRRDLLTWNTNGHLETEHSFAPLLPTLRTAAGALAYLSHFYFIFPPLWGGKNRNSKLYPFLRRRWYFDEAFSCITYFCRTLAGTLRKELDRGFLELLGPRGLYLTIHKISNSAANVDRRRVTQRATLRTLRTIFTLARI